MEYHERQRLRRCGLHAVNNLLQRRAYTAADFDRLASEIPRGVGDSGLLSAWVPQYRSALPGIGNYDASVLLVALARQGLECQQHDARKR